LFPSGYPGSNPGAGAFTTTFINNPQILKYNEEKLKTMEEKRPDEMETAKKTYEKREEKTGNEE
jgi:hypothetical protein